MPRASHLERVAYSRFSRSAASRSIASAEGAGLGRPKIGGPKSNRLKLAVFFWNRQFPMRRRAPWRRSCGIPQDLGEQLGLDFFCVATGSNHLPVTLQIHADDVSHRVSKLIGAP